MPLNQRKGQRLYNAESVIVKDTYGDGRHVRENISLHCFDIDSQVSFCPRSFGIISYNGLESCILNNESYEDESRTSRGEGCVTDSFDDDDDSSCLSSKGAIGSFYSKCLTMKREKPPHAFQHSDIDAMKEKFSKLLLGEDVIGGTKGLNTTSELSNAITNLLVTVFGEIWKLEPLSEERKSKWRKELDWLLSPTNYMVELVPAKQNNANGGIFEIMTPKA
ncbi:PRONE domain [Sesbania bispinosa]|nr:PRONE domain [Sesbania bispinosa]